MTSLKNSEEGSNFYIRNQRNKNCFFLYIFYTAIKQRMWFTIWICNVVTNWCNNNWVMLANSTLWKEFMTKTRIRYSTLWTNRTLRMCISGRILMNPDILASSHTQKNTKLTNWDIYFFWLAVTFYWDVCLSAQSHIYWFLCLPLWAVPRATERLFPGL